MLPTYWVHHAHSFALTRREGCGVADVVRNGLTFSFFLWYCRSAWRSPRLNPTEFFSANVSTWFLIWYCYSPLFFSKNFEKPRLYANEISSFYLLRSFLYLSLLHTMLCEQIKNRYNMLSAVIFIVFPFLISLWVRKRIFVVIPMAVSASHA